jgi:hypothetical protein
MIRKLVYFWLRVIIAELGQNQKTLAIAELGQNQGIFCFQVMKYRKAAIRSRNR